MDRRDGAIGFGIISALLLCLLFAIEAVAISISRRGTFGGAYAMLVCVVTAALNRGDGG